MTLILLIFKCYAVGYIKYNKFIIEVITGGGYSHIIKGNMGICRSTWYAFSLSDSGTGYKNHSSSFSLEEGYILHQNFHSVVG